MMERLFGPPPMDWQGFKGVLMLSIRNGIEEKNLPAAFYVSSQLWTIYECMQELRTPDEDERSFRAHRNGEYTATETAKAYIIHPANGSLMIVPTETKSEDYGFGVRAIVRKVPNEIGYIHNHPWDGEASAEDIAPLITKEHLMETIVTPVRIIMIFRTQELAGKIPDFKQNTGVALSYLAAMGKAKNAVGEGEDASWTVHDWSLHELGLARYEASRHHKKLLFERKI